MKKFGRRPSCIVSEMERVSQAIGRKLGNVNTINLTPPFAGDLVKISEL